MHFVSNFLDFLSFRKSAKKQIGSLGYHICSLSFTSWIRRVTPGTLRSEPPVEGNQWWLVMAVLCAAILARDCLCCLITMRSWEECGGGRASTYWKCTQCSLVLDIWPNAGGLFMGAAKGGPPKGLHPPFRSVIGKWKSIKAFHVSRHVLPLGDSIFPDFVLKTAQVCWPSSSNPSLPLSAPLTQRQLLQHMEQNLAWGRHSTWKIST